MDQYLTPNDVAERLQVHVGRLCSAGPGPANCPAQNSASSGDSGRVTWKTSSLAAWPARPKHWRSHCRHVT